MPEVALVHKRINVAVPVLRKVQVVDAVVKPHVTCYNVVESAILVAVAKAWGYPNAICVDTFEDLDKEFEAAKRRNELSLIEVKCSIGARDDLGRPTTTALENKQNFMEYLKTI
jgi:hypothetical protein